MVTKTTETTDRKPRADAQRNRERILDVAKQEFTRVGAKASLEDIAKKAGVGPGTLYRHFPTREDLLVAVYRSEMEKLAAAERTLADSKSPVEALRAWLLLFVDAVETKHIIAPVLNTLVGDPKKVFETSYAQIHEALRALVKRAIKSGDIDRRLNCGESDQHKDDHEQRGNGICAVFACPQLRAGLRVHRSPDC
ncbi:MAG TPA: TetR/AcrR family transcriptional regulator [Bryobacteraceae bacterium]|nr:TetR/AcrR family transcriptional regulator [Bryobacteraceae bacterium]